MAIGTATAIGLGITAASTGYSFTQAAKQKKEQRKAEDEAQKYLAEARKKLDVNFYEQLGIQKEPYELAREAALIQGAQAIQAGVESERGAAAAAGRIQLAQQEEQRKIAAAMGQEMLGLQKAVAEEEARLMGAQVGLDITEAKGAQKAAAVAEARSAQNLQQGIQGVGKLAADVASVFPDYGASASQRQLGRIQSMGEKRFDLNQPDIQKSVASLGNVGGVDLSRVGGMDATRFKDFMSQLNPQVLQQIRQQLPDAFSSFRPAQYALPTQQFTSPYNFNVPSVGGF